MDLDNLRGHTIFFSITLNRRHWLISASDFPQFTTSEMIRPVPCKLVAPAAKNANSESVMIYYYKPNSSSLWQRIKGWNVRIFSVKLLLIIIWRKVLLNLSNLLTQTYILFNHHWWNHSSAKWQQFTGEIKMPMLLCSVLRSIIVRPSVKFFNNTNYSLITASVCPNGTFQRIIDNIFNHIFR